MKNKFILHAFFVIICASVIQIKSFAAIQNLGQLKTELRQYHKSGAYTTAIANCIQRAEGYITQQASLNHKLTHPKKLAVVLDIDETSLSNYAHMESRDFSSVPDLVNQDFQQTNTPAILATHTLYIHALKQQLAIFFITGRPESSRSATIESLKHAGYKTWSGIYFKHDNKQSNIPFKTASREQIERQGYTIIASIGDQNSDLVGGHALKTFKLPNPYYYVP